MALCDPELAAPDAILDSAGGFCWWYAEVLDAAGNGAVLIASFGLPFLPGYLGGSRRGQPQTPRSRPSLNFVVYEQGRPAFYHLGECNDVFVDDRQAGRLRLRFGASTVTIGEGGVRRCLQADLRLPVDGGHGGVARAHFELEGATPFWPQSMTQGPAPRHVWSPLIAPGRGSVRYAWPGRPTRTLSGEAYCDHNRGAVPFDRLGFDKWIWGRFSRAGRTLAFYQFEGQGRKSSHAFFLEEDGRMRPAQAFGLRLGAPRPGRYGLWRPSALSLGAEDVSLCAELPTAVDDGPFYQRLLTTARDADGETWVGTCEVIAPHRVDLDWQRPLVRMRVSPADEDRASLWLPLFDGPSCGRTRRLLASWQTRAVDALGARLLPAPMKTLATRSRPYNGRALDESPKHG